MYMYSSGGNIRLYFYNYSTTCCSGREDMASFKIIQKFGKFFCNKRRSDEGTSRFQVKNVQFFGRKCMVYVTVASLYLWDRRFKGQR